MAKGRKRQAKKPPANQFRGPREETVVQRRPETEQDRAALAAELERASGGSVPADVARRVTGEWPELASAVTDELGGEVPAAFRRPPPGSVKAKIITGAEPGNALGIQPGDIVAEQQPIGYTETDIDLSGEGSIRAGSKVYRADPVKARELERAAREAGYDPVMADDAGQAMEILRGMTPEQVPARRQPDVIITDDVASLPPGTDPGLVLDFTGDDDDGGGYPGPPTEPVPEGMFLPPGFTPRDPDPPQEMRLSPAAVLAVHDRLAGTMRKPPPGLTGVFEAYIREALAKADAESGRPGVRSKWAGSFWPARSGREWCGVLARQLGTARTYQVSAEMHGEVTSLYRLVQESGKAPWIDRAEVPWPSGFAWLDMPLDFRDRWGRAAYTRALSWDVVYIPYPDGTVPGIRVVSWRHAGDRDAYWDDGHVAIIEENGGLGMGNSAVIPFGQRMWTQRFAGYPVSDSSAVWVKALWHVMESEISVTAKARDPQRPPSWRPRSLTHGEVHVVMLRRQHVVSPDSGPAVPGTRNWTCRWFVDPFWRHVRRDAAWEADNEERDEKNRIVRHHAIPDAARERCITCGAKVVHVATFGKGPAGLPYKKSRQLHRLAR